MTDEELLAEAASMPTVYLDGFGAFRKINGVLRCVGYVIGNGAQLNLIVSLSGAEAGCLEAQRVLEEKPAIGSLDAAKLRLAH
ncbi:hypothetical protein CO683_00700 [Bradyrhizobium ottawaense]|uniref:hypothetical protein n=1 Tax=Bradyrhizobium ottawaense TaxID=931866 RepID=UPI000BE9E02E|nr:hypothetical protein [Bradyrhizobium ottawaense]PDT71711.1 hypothetical protein CO683_00700 [Bradyrhizobium ottawaense]